MKLVQQTNQIVALNDDGKEMGHLSWTVLEDGVLNANHTYVDPAFRGLGVAFELLKALVAMARKDHKKIHATCSYVVKMFSHGDEYADVIDPNRGIGDASCNFK